MSSTTDDDQRVLSPEEIEAERLDDWRLVAGRLKTRFATGSFATGLAMVDRIAEYAERVNHHPDLDLRWGTLNVTLLSHDVSGLTQRDVRLARAVSQIAGEVGATAKPASVKVVALTIDTPNHEEIRPFWQAVLGLKADPDSDGTFLLDPDGFTPSVHLQQTEPHEVPRQRFHIDVDVPPDAADARIRKALDAGGTLVSDEHAPTWWTLADAQGNKVDIATWQGRD